MDPITLTLLAAIAKISEPAVKDAYDAVKKFLEEQFSGIKEATELLEKEVDSKARQALLDEEVHKAKASENEGLCALVETLRGRLGKDAPSQTVTVTQTVTGPRNIFSGTGDVTVHKN
jgi:hypothetical protein